MEIILFVLFLLIAVIAIICIKNNRNSKSNNMYQDTYYTPKNSDEYYSNNTTARTENSSASIPQIQQPYSNIAETNTAEKDAVTKQEYEFNYDYSYMPYRRARLLTKTEHSFFVILIRQALLRGMLVCPKVRLEDIAFVIDKKNKNKYRGYIKSRHIDFILINAQGETIAGIELDDPSHDTEKAQKTDRFKTELFKTIGVPLIRIKTGTDYIVQLNTIFDSLNFKAVDPKKPMIVPDNVQTAKTAP